MKTNQQVGISLTKIEITNHQVVEGLKDSISVEPISVANLFVLSAVNFTCWRNLIKPNHTFVFSRIRRPVIKAAITPLEQSKID